MTKMILAFSIALGLSCIGPAHADTYVVDATETVLLAQADTAPADAGVAAPDTTQPAATAATSSPTTAAAPQASDVGVMTKLWKSGSFFALGIMVVFVGLSIWSKLDKKHAFYIATGLASVGLMVESIRNGNTPNATSVVQMLIATFGIMIAGPGHVKATPPS